MSKSKMNVLDVRENKDIHFLRDRAIHENRVQIGKDKEKSVKFSNEEIFNLIIQPSKLARLLRRKVRKIPVLLHRDGSKKCFTLGKNDLIDPLTNEESEEIVKRNMALGMGKFSPISLKIAIFIIILQFITIASLLFLIFRLRVL